MVGKLLVHKHELQIAYSSEISNVQFIRNVLVTTGGLTNRNIEMNKLCDVLKHTPEPSYRKMNSTEELFGCLFFIESYRG